MKRLVCVAGAVAIIILFGCVARYAYFDYAKQWFVAYNDSYEQGDDATARTYAQRLAWVSRQDSAQMLADLDVTRSIRLSGPNRRKVLEHALKRLDSAFPRNGSHPYQGVEFQKAFLESELGQLEGARRRVQYVCKVMQDAVESFRRCMEEIQPEGMYMNRTAALRYYERATLALNLGIGDPTLMRFQVANALRKFDLDKARRMRAAMVRGGSYTKHMDALYCEGPLITLGANMCADYMAK